MFAKRRVTPYEYNFIEKGVLDLKHSEFYTPSTIDDFMFESDKPAHGDSEAIIFTTDVTMLFNQQRLDKMSSEALVRHFDSMSKNDSALAAVRKSLTDDQLISIVKSRYIQSPSELMAYSSYLVGTYGAELAAHAVPEPTPTPEPSPAPAAE